MLHLKVYQYLPFNETNHCLCQVQFDYPHFKGNNKCIINKPNKHYQ